MKTEDLVNQAMELRRLTGRTALDCRKALSRCDWDQKKAIEFLNKYGWDSHGFLRDIEWFENGRY